MERHYITEQPYLMSITEYFHFMVVLGNVPHQKAFKTSVKLYKEQRNEEPTEFIKYYNEIYLKNRR